MQESNQSAGHPSRRRRGGRTAVAIAVVALLGACDGDGSLSDLTLPDVSVPEGAAPPAATDAPPEATDAPPEATDAPPEATDAPPEATQPPPEQTAPPVSVPEEDDGLSDDSIMLLVLLGLGLLLVAGIAIWMSSRKRSAGAASVAQPGRLTDVMVRARWLHDQASMELLRINDPAQLARTWQSTSPSIVELEGWAAGLAAGSSDPATAHALQNVQGATAGLRGALQSDVSLRTDPAMAGRQDLVQASAQTVQQRRADLDIALADPLLRAQ